MGFDIRFPFNSSGYFIKSNNSRGENDTGKSRMFHDENEVNHEACNHHRENVSDDVFSIMTKGPRDEFVKGKDL